MGGVENRWCGVPRGGGEPAGRWRTSSSLPHSSSSRSLPRGKRSISCRLRSLASFARPWKASSNECVRPAGRGEARRAVSAA